MNNSIKREASPKNTHAIIVGVEKYPVKRLDLDGPANDAAKFSNWLVQRGVPPRNIRLFLSPLPGNENIKELNGLTFDPATEENIRKYFYDYLPKISGDLFWFFWGGHGLITSSTSGFNRRLFFEDSNPDSYRNLNLPSLIHSMRFDSFQEFRKQIFIIDACGEVFNDYRFRIEPAGLDFNPIGRMHKERRQFVYHSSSEGEFAINLSNEKAGLFSKELMNVFGNIQDKTQWPPDMKQISSLLAERFVQLDIEGKFSQMPTCWEEIDWYGNKKPIAVPRYNRDYYKIDSQDVNGKDKPVGAEILLPSIEALAMKIIPGLSLAHIEEAYRNSVPTHWEPPPVSSQPIFLFYECSQSLAKVSKQSKDQLFPLLKFLKYLGNELDERLETELDEWINTAVGQLYDDFEIPSVRKTLNALKQVNKPMEKSLQTKSYLQIRLVPERTAPRFYRVDAWLRGPNKERRLFSGSRLTARHVKELLPVFFRDAAAEDIHSPELCIEFFLSRRQIIEPVDQWETQRDIGGPIKIGARHQVLVRSHERSRIGDPLLGLRKRWDFVKKHCHCLNVNESLQMGSDSITACWIRLNEVESHRVEGLLQDACQLVCVLMEEEPGPGNTGDPDDVLNSLLEAGIPIILWPRNSHCTNIDELRAELTHLVGEGRLDKLPDRIWKLRKYSSRKPGEYSLGNNVTLVWDNPNRLPPDTDYYKSPRL